MGTESQVAQVSKLGVWVPATAADADFARRAQDLGYGTLWLGGSPAGDLAVVDEILAATQRLTVATGIVNIWADSPATVAESFHRIESAFPGRFLLGVGVGHREHTEEYRSPYQALVDYLDALAELAVPTQQTVVAALGPRVLTLAADRVAGAHPYLTTPEHTARAREILGPAKLLVPEQKVVLDTDDARGREVGRKTVKFYLGLRNYANNLRTLGFTADDVAKPGSDRIVDALAPHGDGDLIAAAVKAHLDAGADQVSVQALGRDPWPALEAVAHRLA